MAFTTEFFWPFEMEHSEWWALSCSLYTLLCVCCHSFLGSLSLLPSVITWRTWQAHFKGSKILPLSQESSESKSPVIFAESDFALCPKAEVSESSYKCDWSQLTVRSWGPRVFQCLLFIFSDSHQIQYFFQVTLQRRSNRVEMKLNKTDRILLSWDSLLGISVTKIW